MAKKRSPQRFGIESRTDSKGREQHRGTVYDRRTDKRIRGPWNSRLAAARSWRVDDVDRLQKGTLSGERGPTIGEAIDQFLAGIESVAVHNRSRRPYKPSVVRDYRRDLRGRLAPLIGSTHLRELELPDVQRIVDRLSASGLSASSVRNAVMARRSSRRCRRRRNAAGSHPTTFDNRDKKRQVVPCSGSSRPPMTTGSGRE